jgi:hypothetical protein
MAVLLGSTESKRDLASKIYDYIVNVTIVQGRLLPMNDLYGDGTRWKKDKELFKLVYDQIKQLIKNLD